MCVRMYIRTVCVCIHVAIIEPPESQVALPGTGINYTCQGDNTILLVFNDSITTSEVQAGENLVNIGINFMLDSMGGELKYTVSVNASILNNGTYLYCLDESGKSAKVYIYTVEGKAKQS